MPEFKCLYGFRVLWVLGWGAFCSFVFQGEPRANVVYGVEDTLAERAGKALMLTKSQKLIRQKTELKVTVFGENGGKHPPLEPQAWSIRVL